MSRRWAIRAVPNRGVEVACSLRPGWVAIGMYVRHRGQLRLADLIVCAGEIPAEVDADPSTGVYPIGTELPAAWLAERRYLDSARQDSALANTREPHTVQARMLREIPLDEMQRQALASAGEFAEFGAFLREHGAPASAWRGLADLGTDGTLSPQRVEYLRAAAVYASMPAHLNRPRAVAATELGVTETVLADRLRWARKHGYLTKPGQGSRGGDLTELGAALVARYNITPAGLGRGSKR